MDVSEASECTRIDEGLTFFHLGHCLGSSSTGAESIRGRATTGASALMEEMSTATGEFGIVVRQGLDVPHTCLDIA